MKICKYCNSEMLSEHQTNSHDSRRYKAFFVCPKCHAVCDGEYVQESKGTSVINEEWMAPTQRSRDN